MKKQVKDRVRSRGSRKMGCIAPLVLGLTFIMIFGILGVGCSALFGAQVSDMNRQLNGVEAEFSTYTQQGNLIDSVSAKSMQVNRNGDFDSTDNEGFTEADSDVLKLSIGQNTIHHVGSTMIIAEEGIEKVADAPTRVELESVEPGRPWINFLYEDARNVWKGKAKTIVIRSQDGLPIAVYAGNEVEIYSTDIPKSTRFQVDGKLLFVYRADYTVYDTALLSS